MDVNFWQKYQADGLKMIAIDSNALDVGDVPGLTSYVNWVGPPGFPVATEASGQGTYSLFSSTYEGSNPFPVDIIIDKSGTIRYIAREYDPFAMDALVQQLLAE